MKDIIQIRNYGRTTFLCIAGITLGSGILGVSFSQPKEKVTTPELTVTVDIKALLKELSEIEPEKLEQAKAIIKAYLDEYQE